jgi:hypothetical protein
MLFDFSIPLSCRGESEMIVGKTQAFGKDRQHFTILSFFDSNSERNIVYYECIESYAEFS